MESAMHSAAGGRKTGRVLVFGLVQIVFAFCLIHSGAACAAEFDTSTKPSTMTWNDAEATCKGRGGTLPSVADLKAIADKTGDGSYTGWGWSTGIYWTNEAAKEGHSVVFLGDGKDLPFPDQAKQWAVCVAVASKPTPLPETPGTFDSAGKPKVLAWSAAEAMCSERGKRLPSVADLQRIAKGAGDGSFAKMGLLEQVFWTREPGGEGHRGVFMGDGSAKWFHDATKNWSLCVE